jgi:hypothetical protein
VFTTTLGDSPIVDGEQRKHRVCQGRPLVATDIMLP